MIVPLPRSRRSLENNILPLIDVVFMLLIFFMVAGTLSAPSPFELEPARADAVPRVSVPASAGVVIGPEGRIAFAGEPLALEDLADRVRRWADATRMVDRPLTLRADARADSERLLAVIDALRRAGIQRVRLLAVDGYDGAD